MKKSGRTQKKQVALSRALLTHVQEAALWAWKKIDADARVKGNYTRTFKKISEPCADFLRKLM